MLDLFFVLYFFPGVVAWGAVRLSRTLDALHRRWRRRRYWRRQARAFIKFRQVLLPQYDTYLRN